MTVFDRIPPDHPLAEAAREVNTMAEEEGLQAAVGHLDMSLTTSQLAYLSEQRAIRAFAVYRYGYNLGCDPLRDEVIARRVITDADWPGLGRLLTSAYMDGIAIGWKGHQIKGCSDAE